MQSWNIILREIPIKIIEIANHSAAKLQDCNKIQLKLFEIRFIFLKFS